MSNLQNVLHLRPIRSMNYARFLTAVSAARRPSPIRILSESDLYDYFTVYNPRHGLICGVVLVQRSFSSDLPRLWSLWPEELPIPTPSRSCRPALKWAEAKCWCWTSRWWRERCSTPAHTGITQYRVMCNNISVVGTNARKIPRLSEAVFVLSKKRSRYNKWSWNHLQGKLTNWVKASVIIIIININIS